LVPDLGAEVSFPASGFRRTFEEGRRTEDEMSANEYVAGFIAMAVLIALILSIGTLRMAGLVHRPHWHHHHSA
jgi:hypothetical protein